MGCYGTLAATSWSARQSEHRGQPAPPVAVGFDRDLTADQSRSTTSDWPPSASAEWLIPGYRARAEYVLRGRRYSNVSCAALSSSSRCGSSGGVRRLDPPMDLKARQLASGPWMFTRPMRPGGS